MAMEKSAESPPDIDQGWAFVVMLCGTVTLIMSRGLTYTGAIFYIIFLDEFEESTEFTSWALSLNIFCTYIFTLLAANVLIFIIGPRLTAIMGCALSFVGLLTCSFATNLTTILVMYGIVTGCGFALSFVPAYTMISLYFRKYRIIAYGVMNIGSGIGQLTYPALLTLIIDQYAWRGAFIILSGINLNFLVLAACYMNPRKVDEREQELETKTESKMEKVLTVLKKIKQSIKMFKIPAWPLFSVAMGLYSVAINGYQMHISNFGRVSGLTAAQFTFLPSMAGAGSIVGSLVMGIVTKVLKCHIIVMVASTFLILATFSIAVTFFQDAIAFFICSFGVGYSLAVISLVYEAVIFIIGFEAFIPSTSFSMFFAALGSIAGGPLAARVYEIDPSYHWSYRTLGLIVLVATLFLIPSMVTFKAGRIKMKKSYDDIHTCTSSCPHSPHVDIPARINDATISKEEVKNSSGESVPDICDASGVSCDS